MIITVLHKVWGTILLPSSESYIYAFRNEYIHTYMHLTKNNENRPMNLKEKDM